MKRNFLSIILGMVCTLSVHGQLTLEDCQEKARENYPLIKQYELIQKTEEYTLSNANKGYLPQFSILGRVSYQSNTTELPDKYKQLISGLTGHDVPNKGRLIDKDQYNLNLNVSQVIWDGGAISAKRNIAKATSNLNSKLLDTELYQIRERVNNLFFGVLLIEAQLKQLGLYGNQLQTSYDQVKSFMNNGVANESDLDVIMASQYTNDQSKARLKGMGKSYKDMLSIMIGKEITQLVSPQEEDASYMNLKIDRPELRAFDATNQLYDSKKKVINAINMPHLGLFANGGYGQPNLNLLNNKFDSYLMGGISLYWNFGNLYSRKNDLKNIDIEKQTNENRRETFLFNTNLQISQENNEIQKKKDLLKYDDKIIELKTNIRNAAQVKAENGIISVQEMMREIDSEEEARENKIIHEIDLLVSIYNLKTITNN